MEKIQKQLEEVRENFEQSKNGLPTELKARMAEIILHIIRKRKSFGLFVILGWENKWEKFADTPDISQDIFAGHNINVRTQASEGKRQGLAKTINFDGAILIDSTGNIIHSGTMIEGLRPKIAADKINPGRFDDLSTQFGFRQKVHMRHLAAITASYIFKGTTVFTVSEESGHFHIFESGKILYSTLSKENK